MKKMMKKLSGIFALLTLFVTMSSFASIIKGTSQTITFNSEPSGAKVYLDGQMFGETPLTLKLKKNKYDSIMVKKEGYVTQTAFLNKDYDGVALINIFWDLSTTDLITGAAFEYNPNQFFFDLEKRGAS